MPNLKYPIGKFEAGPVDRSKAIEEIASLPSKLRAAVDNLSDSQLDTPYRPEGWTVRQVVHHFADSHMNGYIRHKLTLTEDRPTIKPYDEASWAKLPDAKLPIETTLKLIDSLQERWTALLNSIPDASWSREYNHPEHPQPMPLEVSAAMYAWHCRHHTAHITQLRQREGW